MSDAPKRVAAPWPENAPSDVAEAPPFRIMLNRPRRFPWSERIRPDYGQISAI